MADLSASRLWLMRALFLGLCVAILFFLLLPLSGIPAVWAGPDLLLALTLAWAQRRPDYVPALSVALVMLLADLLLHRPPGLLALLVVLGAEQLKSRAGGLRDASFAGEWAAASLVIMSVTMINRVVLWVLMVDQAPLALTLSQMVMTVVIYPVVVIVSHFLLGVRRLSPGEEDVIGARL
ncbi:MAG: rod shape-determining protein MreD [Rhodobacteraceae bacterium]|nr:MAG: rod shape-determining protein MreD [Paracoccaceae bacterium]